MTTKLKMLPVRVSPALRALIDQAGPVNAATRALIILGAEAVGLDLTSLEREVAGLLAEDLAPQVLVGLKKTLLQLTEHIEVTSVLQSAHESLSVSLVTASTASSEDNPFTLIGIEV